MGKALLLYVAAVLMAGGFMLHNGSGGAAKDGVKRSAEYQAQTLAREIALSAYNLAVQEVLSGAELDTRTGPYQGGTYQVRYTPRPALDPDSVAVEVTGRMPLYRGGGTAGHREHVIRATFARQVGEETTRRVVPTYMRYGLLSEHTLTMNGNVGIVSEDSELNADVHTNTNIQVNGNNEVTGIGSYVGSAHSNPPQRLYTTFAPNAPDGQSTVRRTDRVDIPRFNAYEHRNEATQTTNGNLILSGQNTFGTRENPVIWYVSGDLTVRGGTTASGYVVFLVNGNINFDGNFSNTSGTSYGESNIGLYTTGNVNMSGRVSVMGQILAGQNVNMSGNSRLYGSITTAGTVNFNGTVDIIFREPSTALTTVLETETEVVRGDFELVSVRER